MKVNLYISMFFVLVNLVIHMFISFVSTLVTYYGNKMIALVQCLFNAPFLWHFYMRMYCNVL